MSKVSHYSNVSFLRYTHPRYMKRLSTNMEKQYEVFIYKHGETIGYVKNSLLLQKNTKFTGK